MSEPELVIAVVEGIGLLITIAVVVFKAGGIAEQQRIFGDRLAMLESAGKTSLPCALHQQTLARHEMDLEAGKQSFEEIKKHLATMDTNIALIAQSVAVKLSRSPTP